MTKTNISGKKIYNSSKEDLCLRSIGVLKRSNELRNNTLQRNIGKYQMYDTTLNPPIGEVYNIYENENTTPNSTGKLGLMGYTDNLIISDDGYNGNVRRVVDSYESRFYTPNNNLMDLILEIIGVNDKEYKDKKYDNYIDYINHVYSNDFTWLNAIKNWLDKSTIKGTLEYSKVGVLRDIDIWASLNGVILTNINNFSGSDTALGTFSNYMYANTLNWGAYFNTVRNSPSITNDLKSYIGLNNTTKVQISDILKNNSFGRVEIPIPSIISNVEDSQSLINQYLGDSTKRYIFESFYPNLKENDVKPSKFGPGYTISYLNKDETTQKPYLNGYTEKNKYGNHEINFQKQSLLSNNVYATYTEGDKVGSGNQEDLDETSQSGDKYISIQNTGNFNNVETLLNKTNKFFNDRRIGTLLGRFHTSVDSSGGLDSTLKTMLNTAVHEKFGSSRGRNLLTKKAERGLVGDNVHDYENPYCRVWTFHHQYDRITRLIRPFTNNDSNGNDTVIGIGDLQKKWDFSRGAANQGGEYLSKHTSLNKNGFVNIAPTSFGEIDVKKCMFSIENLAWKGIKLDEALSPDQIGPLGGRIMWFPPYDLSFSENVGVNLESSVFIGRGEPLYTYSNTERTGTLTFKLVVDHPSIINYWEGRNGSNNQTDVENDNDLLRFFAGCDTINGVSEKTIVSVTETVDNDKSEEVQKPVSEPPKDVVFCVFFPNNYSGYDDVNNQVFNGMDYLFYGVQCSNRCNEKDTKGVPFNPFDIEGQEPYGYEMGSHSVSLDSVDCPYPAIDGVNGKKWQYRIDNKYKTQVLISKDGYKDTASFKLNNTLLTDTGYDDCTHSFAEVYVALSTKQNQNKINEHVKRCGINIDRINELKDIMSNFEISNIEVYGYASSDGNNKLNEVNIKRNNELALNRARSIKKWIENTEIGQKINKGLIEVRQHSIETVKPNNVSSIESKKARFAKVFIHFKNGQNKKLSQTQQMTVNEEVSKRKRNIAKVAMNVFSENREPFGVLTNPIIPYSANNYLNDERNMVGNTPIESVKSDDYLLPTSTPNIKINTTGSLRRVNNLTISPDGNKMVSTSSILVKYNNERYDNESKFFEYLNKQSPLYFKRLSEKIKFFHPAFHSTTPEGFNARLTFLHQCTRQGPTISSDDNKNFAATASNLSFGRPPFCVLRIGDFYNTKIIIDSMSINYEPLWDLNPEGIGVQPMVATVNLNFKFVGGSSLAGPIVKLQNAVSFNFFANTPVYDNRSDRVEYSDYKMKDGDYKEWLPSMDNNKKQ